MSLKSAGYIFVSLLFAFGAASTMNKVDSFGGGFLAIVMIAYAGFALYQASKS